jgi:hypothetical protein
VSAGQQLKVCLLLAREVIHAKAAPLHNLAYRSVLELEPTAIGRGEGKGVIKTGDREGVREKG